MKQMNSIFKYFVLGIAAILVLSGCKANVITKINSDGSGKFTQEVGFTAQEMTTLSSFGTGSDFCTNMGGNNSISGSSVSQEKRGDEVWCIFDTSFSTLEELKSLYSEADTTANDINITDGQLHYDVTVNMSGANATAGLLQTKWILVMPGAVTNHNADEVKGTTLTWDLTTGENSNLLADSSTKGGLTANWRLLLGIGLLCLCMLVLLVIVVVVVFLVVRNNKKKQASKVETVSP